MLKKMNENFGDLFLVGIQNASDGASVLTEVTHDSVSDNEKYQEWQIQVLGGGSTSVSRPATAEGTVLRTRSGHVIRKLSRFRDFENERKNNLLIWRWFKVINPTPS